MVRHNADLQAAYGQGLRTGGARPGTVRLADTGELGQSERGLHPRACKTCFRWPRRSSKGPWRATSAGARTTSPSSPCPISTATDPAERRRQAEAWCDRFEENNRKWLKTTIAALAAGRRTAN